MKLSDILFEGIDISKETPVSFNGRKFFPVSGDLIGGKSSQAQVYDTGRGMVTKLASIGSMNDSTMKFLQIILDHQDNPFFPKIYHARVYKDKDERVKTLTLLVRMEKLTPLTSDKIQDAAEHLFNQVGFELSDFDKKNIDLAPERRQGHVRLQKLAQKVDNIFGATGQGRTDLLQKSKNPKFVEAIELLSPYIDRGGSDLHAGNWMVRLTGHGPQLVIIDPFFPGPI